MDVVVLIAASRRAGLPRAGRDRAWTAVSCFALAVIGRCRASCSAWRRRCRRRAIDRQRARCARAAAAGALAGGGSARSAAWLVVAEITLAVALVIGASLLMRSFIALGRVSTRLQQRSPAGRWRPASPRASTCATSPARSAPPLSLRSTPLPRLAEVAGVTSVAGIRGLPEARSRFGHESNGGYWLEGGPQPGDRRRPPAAGGFHRRRRPTYFKTMDDSDPARAGLFGDDRRSTARRWSRSSTTRWRARRSATAIRSAAGSPAASIAREVHDHRRRGRRRAVDTIRRWLPHRRSTCRSSSIP